MPTASVSNLLARETSGKGTTGGTSEMGKTRGDPNLSMSRLSRMSRTSRAIVCGAGGLFQHPDRCLVL